MFTTEVFYVKHVDDDGETYFLGKGNRYTKNVAGAKFFTTLKNAEGACIPIYRNGRWAKSENSTVETATITHSIKDAR